MPCSDKFSMTLHTEMLSLGTSDFLTQVCHRIQVRYIIHLYCLAEQAGFYSNLVECLPLDPKVPSLAGALRFFKSPWQMAPIVNNLQVR